MAASPFTTKDEQMLVEIRDAAERRLEAQLTAALASDQRALNFAGFAATPAAALTGLAASILIGRGPEQFLGWLALAAAVALAAAMALAVFAARPSKWFFPGGKPESWLADIAAGKRRLERLQDLAEDYNHRITHNDAIMKYHGKLLHVSATLAFLTPLASAIALVVYLD